VKRAAQALVVGAAGFVAGCAPTINAQQIGWTMTVNGDASDVEVESDNTIEWCPALLFNQFDPNTGQNIARPNVTVLNLTASVIADDVVEPDIYTLTQNFPDARPWGSNAATFDIGPIGTFYEEDPISFAISSDGSVQVNSPSPPTVNITRTLVDGHVDDDRNFSITFDYDVDCDTIEVTAFDPVTGTPQPKSCDCASTTRIQWDLAGQG
jgi:hypothetical protein